MTLVAGRQAGSLLRARRQSRLWWGRQRRRWGSFSLTRRILFVNLAALAFLLGGMLYLDRYERGLIDTELDALTTQGGLFSAALSEGAVLQDLGEGPVLVPSLAQGMVRRLTEPAGARARLFLPNGALIVDSRALPGPGGSIQVEELAPPEKQVDLLDDALGFLSGMLRARDHYPPYLENAHQTSSDYPEVVAALQGRAVQKVRSLPGEGGLALSVAVPIHRYKQVLGAVLLSTGSAELDRQVNSVRGDILRLFLFALVVIFLLSIYLARTIAHPVRQLAQAAQDVRRGNGRQVEIPDFRGRRDEIGELSVALAEMTSAIWRRMDAIECFAADVAHEIKNPLTSLRSAVETAARVTDPAKQQRLMAIILDDVQRLDRLISDISEASRLDAEMSRFEREPVSLSGMLPTLVDTYQLVSEERRVAIAMPTQSWHDDLTVLGRETRLVQVLRNLIGNALSFSPSGGRIELAAWRAGDEIVITVEDGGPGIPEGKLHAIFDRFYSERPAGEKFGTHSGLGLSISKQIVEAHGGTISAENRWDDSLGRVVGARFVVRLPAYQEAA